MAHGSREQRDREQGRGWRRPPSQGTPRGLLPTEALSSRSPVSSQWAVHGKVRVCVAQCSSQAHSEHLRPGGHSRSKQRWGGKLLPRPGAQGQACHPASAAVFSSTGGTALGTAADSGLCLWSPRVARSSGKTQRAGGEWEGVRSLDSSMGPSLPASEPARACCPGQALRGGGSWA